MQMRSDRFLPFLCAAALCLIGLVSAQQAPTSAETKQKQGSRSAIIYADGGGFMASGPEGWVMDHEVGQQLGTCCVFYPEGTTWDDADAVMYPSIATKSPGQSNLKEFMQSDLEDFRDHNPGMTFEDSEDIFLKQNKKACIRYFYGVNSGSSEVVAYIDEPKVIAIFVLSAKSPKSLNESLRLFRSFVQSYIYMDVRFANKDDIAPSAQKP